jgi:hypothetical protein
MVPGTDLLFEMPKSRLKLFPLPLLPSRFLGQIFLNKLSHVVELLQCTVVSFSANHIARLGLC